MIRLALTLWAFAVLLIAGLGSAAGDLNLRAPAIDVTATPRGSAVTAPGGVLLIVIDGLRADVAAAMPSLEALGSRGARARLWADGPTFSAGRAR